MRWAHAPTQGYKALMWQGLSWGHHGCTDTQTSTHILDGDKNEKNYHSRKQQLNYQRKVQRENVKMRKEKGEK